VSTGPGSATAPPGHAAVAAEPRPAARRRRRLGRRALRGTAPYVLLLPTAAVIVAVLGYPIYLLVKLSFQRYGLPELLAQKGVWIGLDNYRAIVHDSQFWDVLVRTVAFTAVNVGLTMLFGTLIALLLVKLGAFMRLLLTTGLVLVWAMPPVVAVNIFYWMVDFEFGVLNWTLTELHLGNFIHHEWFENPISGFGVITAVIVWGAIPFVTITVYAGLAQVPRELVEAAEIDGAGPLRVFRDVTFPILKPIFLILTSLSIIWDFGVFTQPYLLICSSQVDATNYLMGVYVFIEGYAHSDFGRGAAISLLMLLIVAVLSVFYVRRMVKMGEVVR
jgi:N,N'-diacetylchitobiose transport system permease protein